MSAIAGLQQLPFAERTCAAFVERRRKFRIGSCGGQGSSIVLWALPSGSAWRAVSLTGHFRTLADAGLGVTPELYINSKPTSWNRFGDDLKNELKLRPKWVVYVQADPVLPWADIVNAIDVAKGLHADVVLLTIQPTIQPRAFRAKGKKQK